MRRLMPFGLVILGTLGGAFLAEFGRFYVSDGPAMDLWLARRWFLGAVIGACAVGLTQILVRWRRGTLRQFFSTTSLLELLAVMVIVAGLGQNWYNAQSYVDARKEWRTQYGASRWNGTSPDTAEASPFFVGQPPSLPSRVLIWISKAVGVIGALLALCGLLARLASAEASLPERVRNRIALILTVAVACLGFLVLFARLRM